MKTTLHFQQNPAGINQVLTILPGQVSVNFNPTAAWLQMSDSDLSETILILAGQGFTLQGDFRRHYEEALAAGGIEACVQFYLNAKPRFGGRWSSPQDPWQMTAWAFTNALREAPPALTNGGSETRCEMALAV